MPTFPFTLESAVLDAPFGCVCGVGGPPFVATRIPVPANGDVYLCASCVKEIVRLFSFVPAADHDALREELSAANVHIGELDGALVRAQTHAAELEQQLESAQVDGLRDTITALQATIHTQAREIAALKRGNASSVIREAVAGIASAAAAPAAKSKASKAA